MRDDFNQDIKWILAQRAGNRCSNPSCRRPTSGPRTEDAMAVNIGVAAHIHAAPPVEPPPVRIELNIAHSLRTPEDELMKAVTRLAVRAAQGSRWALKCCTSG